MGELFDYVAVVGLSEGPVLEHVFPLAREAAAKGIGHFCWPEGKAALEAMVATSRSENFSFVLTESDGSKRFGYCRRFVRLSPPVCLCAVSKIPSVALFQDLLNVVEQRRTDWNACVQFLSACLEEPCPKPGEKILVRVPGLADGMMDELRLTRPEVNEILLDYVTFCTLFSCVSVKNIVRLFSNALLERRIILVAENLATLSSCVMAASNLLQPFHWQHVYIPVLPLVLMDYCFSEDSQILTNLGFLALDDYIRVADHVLVAGVDSDSGKVVFEKASRLIVNPVRQQELVLFESERGETSLLVTPEHDMFVSREGKFSKEKAAALVGRVSEMKAGVSGEGHVQAKDGWMTVDNIEMRDRLVEELVLGGMHARYEQQENVGWRVEWSRKQTVTMTRAERVHYSGRTWCVTVPSGLVIARRVAQNKSWAPVVCGNCTAPMPFFVGVLKSCLPMLETMPLEEVLVLDVENDKFLMDPNFEDVLPKDERNRLVKTLKAINPTPDRDSDLQIASCFYQFFHDIFSGYEHFYELKELALPKNAPPGTTPPQGWRFDMARFAATKPPSIRLFLDHFSNSQILQTFMQESESEERRYRFVSQQDYIQHLAVSRDLEMADAVRNVGRVLGNAWKGVKEAAAKKRAEKEMSGSLPKEDALTPVTPVRVPDSENIDIILAKEMTAKRLAKQQEQQHHGSEQSPMLGRRQTHRPCGSCNMYIDIGMSMCPHCQRPQAPVVIPLEPIVPSKPVALLDERYKRPPPPPPKKNPKSGKKPPPPPPAPPKKNPSSMESAVMPDISTLHLTLSHIFEDEGLPGETEDQDMTDLLTVETPELVAPPEEAPKPEFAELLHAPAQRIAVSKHGRSVSASNVDLEEAKTPVMAPRISAALGGSSNSIKPIAKRPPPPPIAPPAVPKEEEQHPAARLVRTPLQPHRPAPPRPPEELSTSPVASSARFCAHCGARTGDAKLCGSCGRAIVVAPAPAVAATKWKKPSTGGSGGVPASDRGSRRRQCSCGADNEVTAAQCASCKTWF